VRVYRLFEKHVVACASVCKSWREMCKKIVSIIESSGKITFPGTMSSTLLIKYIPSVCMVLRHKLILIELIL